MGQTITINPATEEQLSEYVHHSEIDASSLVEAGHAAFLNWRTTSMTERGHLMHKLADIIERDKNDLATLMAKEMGKPVVQGQMEAERCAMIIRYTADEDYKALQEEERSLDKGKTAHVLYQPLGVILGIQPWNFPLYQAVRYAAPALMAGNAVLLKHAPNVWGIAAKVKDMIDEAGFPKDLFNILYTDNDVTATVIAHDHVQGVAFTGSNRGGSAVAKMAGKHIKKTVLELGGSDPYIILDDADLDLAIPLCIRGRIGNAGQTCVAAKRFIVHQDIYDAFKESFVSAMSDITYGDPMDINTKMGPIAREDLRDGLHHQVTASIEMGATALLGCEMPDGKGYFYPSSVLEVTKIDKRMPCYSEELFGPVATLFKVSDEQEAIALANDHEYGLGAGVFSKDEKRAINVAKQIESGMVSVNGFYGSQPNLPFGGVKKSGYGREHGGFGIREFTNIKSIMIGDK
jgi:succinate-semialdehyde dehydrogenase/glutarate-semialdehyde dehydrogenase